MSLASGPDSCGEIDDALKTQPDGLHAWLAVTLARPRKPPSIATRRTTSLSLGGVWALSFDSGRKPPCHSFLLEQQGASRSGQVRPRRMSREIRQATTMNSARARSNRSTVLNCKASTRQPFLRTWKNQFDLPARPVPVDQFGRRFKTVNRPIGQQPPFHRLDSLGGAFLPALPNSSLQSGHRGHRQP